MLKAISLSVASAIGAFGASCSASAQMLPPIIASQANIEPRILGGKPTDGYGYVVAILLDGSTHCTGTAIAKRTILTAAHCIYGYEEQIKTRHVSYLIGKQVTTPVYGPKFVVNSIYPTAIDPFQYSAASRQHDIGLLFTDQDIPITGPNLHDKNPQWSNILQNRQLKFVGFGFNTSSGGGLGTRREAPWPVDSADATRFYYMAAGKDVCAGDSGGPAFYSDDKIHNLLVGVTSSRTAQCNEGGADTRVDVHYEWIKGHLK